MKQFNSRAQWSEHRTGVPEVVGTISTWNPGFFSVVPSPVANQLSLTLIDISVALYTQLVANRQPACLSAKLLSKSRQPGFEVASDFKLCLLNSGDSQRMARNGSQTRVESTWKYPLDFDISMRLIGGPLGLDPSRPDHNTGGSVPYSFRTVHEFSSIPQNRKQ